MGLLNLLAGLHRRWFAREEAEPERKRRCLFESMENRHMLSATPIHLGAVYTEGDSGADHAGDTFEIMYEGGAPGTQLTHLVIDGDHGTPGLSFGDMIFDTVQGGLGADQAFGFQILSSNGIGSVHATVTDGGSTLTLDFTGFDAGEKLIFSIDVDEVQDYDPSETNLEVINEGIDPIASGVEFQGSKLSATFTAPTYYDVSGQSQFRNQYDPLFSGTNLISSSDDANHLPTDDAKNNHDRTTGVMLPLQQQPLPISVAGYVYVDNNLDLQRDPSDNGLAGVTVALWKKVGSDYVSTGLTTTTDIFGHYSFDHDLGLEPGVYQVRETQPSGYFSVGATAGTVNGVARGSAASADVLSEVDLSHGGDDGVEYNFAEALPVSIHGSVHVTDRNGDCADDGAANTPGIAGVVIELRNSSGLLQTTTTDAQGNYIFAGLFPGTYTVHELTPLGYLDGDEHVGTVNASAVGAIAGDDWIGGIALGSGQNGVNYDFCESLPATLSGYVYSDLNQNGVRESGEAGIAGVTLKLLDASGNQVALATTDANGFYHFDALSKGVYRVMEVQPDGWLDGLDAAGTISGIVVGNAVNPGDEIQNVSLLFGDASVENDFGEWKTVSIRGSVHVADRNGNCDDDGDENLPGIPGVVIELRNASGLLQTTTTDANGNYSFTGLPPGTYTVHELTPIGYLDGDEHVGTVGGVDDGQIAGDDLVSGISLTSGQAGIEYDFCENLPSSLSGYVYHDGINSGVRDPNEAGIAGVTVLLFGADGTQIASTVTDAQGFYRFAGLAAGSYRLVEVQPSGWLDGKEAAGTVNGVVTGVAADPGDAIDSINLLWGDDSIENDFGEVLPAIVSGYVFQDGGVIDTPDGKPPANLDSIRDGKLTPDDIRIPGVVLELRNALTGEAIRGEDVLPGLYPPGPLRAVTDANGYYEFRGLREGSYAVVQVQPQGYIDGLDTPGSRGGIAVNPHSGISPQVLQPFAIAGVNVNDDAIIRIPIAFGTQSVENNFSEVLIRQSPTTPTPPTVPPPFLFPVGPTPRPGLETNPFVLATPGVDATVINNRLRQDEYTPYGGGGDFTWHLSVVDAGAPRGNSRSTRVDPPALMRPAKFLELTQWRAEKMRAGKWIVPGGKESEFGLADATALTGDFNGDGLAEFALFVGGEWFIDINGNGRWDDQDLWAHLGSTADRPVVGDWDGDGKDDIGIFGPQWERDHIALQHEPGLPDAENDSTAPLRHHTPRAGKNIPPTKEQATNGLRMLQPTAVGARRGDLIDHVFQLGASSDVPISGDFNGDGIDTIGVFQGGTWRLDVNGDGRLTAADRTIKFGNKQDVPIVGDFDGNGVDEIGVFRAGKWIIDSNHNGEIDAADQVFELGGAGDTPVVGDFNGDGVDEPGLFRAATPAAQVSRR